MPQNPRSTDDANAPTDGSKSLLTRRTYVRSIAAAATATMGGAAVGTVAADEFETITVGAGERRVVTVESGETYENVLVDCTAEGAHVTFAAQGSGWTIRNVGVEGRVGGKEAVFGVADTGGDTSRIENVYVGDGAQPGHRIGLGIWVAPAHSGHLEIDGVNVQEMGDNSFYCSAPGSGAGGTVDIRNCYSANSWVSHFRLAEGTVENCVALNDERHKDGRGVWAWSPGEVSVVDCDLAMNGRHYAIEAGANGKGSAVSVSGTQFTTDFNGGLNEVDGGAIELADDVGNDPDTSLPAGCPDAAATAAGGRE